jgi:hypothetical protein
MPEIKLVLMSPWPCPAHSDHAHIAIAHAVKLRRRLGCHLVRS